MRRIAAAGCVLLTLGLGGTALGAGNRGPARSSAQQPLEKLTVPAATGSTPITTKTTLKKGASYRLVVSDTVTTSFTGPGPTIGEKQDAFYCFEEINEPAVSPTLSCTFHTRRVDVLRTTNGFVDQALGLKPPGIAYQPSHRYEFPFKAPRTGKLGFYTSVSPSIHATGAFHLELYGQAAKKKKKKKRKKRVVGCPALRASNTAHASSLCHWSAEFQVEQKGSPDDSFPAPGTGFVDSETTGLGKIFFKSKPKPGRSATGRAAGLLIHTDTYQSVLNPFQFTEGEIRLQPLTGTYEGSTGQLRLTPKTVVTSVTGVVYSREPSGDTVQGGDSARIGMLSDLPLHREDFLKASIDCGQCGKDLAGAEGLHIHEFRVGPNDKLRVTIGRPHQLAGQCNCRI